MSRRHRAERREILPDPKFGDLDLAKLINRGMYDGKKSTFEQRIYEVIEKLDNAKVAVNDNELDQEALRKSRGLALWKLARENARPLVEVRSRRVGGATYQVPMEVRPDRGYSIADKNTLSAARGRGKGSIVDRLYAEILDAAQNRGAAVKKKEETHKMAEANRAFAHYRW
ncbi:MAG: 30S ribosomal protein S7 [Alphaproteobacteria bacterium]|nr:30S ribosomal protein S7 [Alphaproteobacteria bacterium]